MKASGWESLSCRTWAVALLLDLVPICFHWCQQLFYWWGLSTFCLHETRTLWDCGETGCSAVGAVTVAPTRGNISVGNNSMENMGTLHLLSSGHLSVNSPLPRELTAKEEFKEGMVPYHKAQICWVSCPYLSIHKSIHPLPWHFDVYSFSHIDLWPQLWQQVYFCEVNNIAYVFLK